MAVLPTGFSLPPLPYLIGLLAGLVTVAAALATLRPTVGERHVAAAVPWMLVGAVAHVLYVVEALPAAVRPLGGAPAVYATVAVLAGGVWVVLETVGGDVPGPLASAGMVVLAPLAGGALLVGGLRGSLSPLWPAVGLVVAAVVSVVVWAWIRRLRPGVRVAGRLGPLVVFSHTLDGISTAIGVDILGYGERTPVSQLVIEVGRALPTAEFVGAGWLFVVVKIALSAVVLVVLSDLVREEPAEGNLLLGVVAAVGLGPGAHNVLLFAVGLPA